ncbi:histidine phosphatase family protein [Candidatus Woesebacteria bacterium]|nr:histidine phosphatase family protein [Candidatus Woesebacteria bacterium]
MTKLILVRHGQTAKNTGGKMHSAGDPELLNELGRKQISLTAKKLKAYKPSMIYASKEARANQSAEIISKVCRVEMISTEGLQERNWGIYAGKSWPEIKPVLEGKSTEERYLWIPENGESWKAFETRLKKIINKILKDNEGKTVIVVTHGGAIRALMPYLLHLPKEESFNFDPDNASITIFNFEKGKFEKEVYNDTSHLK